MGETKVGVRADVSESSALGERNLIESDVELHSSSP